MRTQKEMRKAFWQYLKETNPALYTYGKRSKRQNEQVTDIRILFVEWLNCSDIIPQTKKEKWTL